MTRAPLPPPSARLRAAPLLDVAVERVVAGVGLGAGEPAVERRPAGVEHPRPGPGPVDRLGRLGPEALRILHRAGIGFVEASRHGVPPGMSLPRPSANSSDRQRTAATGCIAI